MPLSKDDILRKIKKRLSDEYFHFSLIYLPDREESNRHGKETRFYEVVKDLIEKASPGGKLSSWQKDVQAFLNDQVKNNKKSDDPLRNEVAEYLRSLK
jgi:hypothetical protein